MQLQCKLVQVNCGNVSVESIAIVPGVSGSGWRSRQGLMLQAIQLGSSNSEVVTETFNGVKARNMMASM